MNLNQWSFLSLLMMFAFQAVACVESAVAQPADESLGNMVRDALHEEANQRFEAWRGAYEERTELDDIAAYQKRLQNQFIESIGGLPERTPLNAKITGTVQRSGITVEKVLFESQPNFFVTSALFLPDAKKFPPPWPAVIVVCGHAAEGKQQVGYQSGTALAALHGMAAMIVDPVGQGERNQLLNADGKPAIKGSTSEHTLIGTTAILVGWNTARWMIHDGMRAIDYLQSRNDIQADRIGCMGNSGGGTQTAHLMALDQRITAAAPSCYITSFKRLLETIGPQDAEQNIFGQIAWGMDHADYLMMRAPKPTLVACATHDFFDINGVWDSYRDANRLFQRFGRGLNLQIIEVDAPHGWHPLIRKSSVEFMAKHLAGKMIEVVEPPIETLSTAEINVTAEGQVLKLPNAISAFDHVRAESERLAIERAGRTWAPDSLRDAIRTTAGVRELARLPNPKVEQLSPVRIGNLDYHPVNLHSDGIVLAGFIARPENDASATAVEGKAKAKRVTILATFEGKDSLTGAGNEIESRVAKGETVFALDIRGTGVSRPTGKRWYHERFGVNGGNATIAYLLGKSLVGLRAEDCLVAARWISEHEQVDGVHLIATGEVTIPALHAAALEPQLFASVESHHGLRSWSDLAASNLSNNQVPGIVHGALRVYDLPDLAKLAGPFVSIHHPHDAMDQPILSPKLEH